MAWCKDPKVLTGPFLKHLHMFLVKLSPNGSLEQDGPLSIISMGVSTQWFNYTDIIDLSNLLFEELDKQFEKLRSGKNCLPLLVVSDENGCTASDDNISPERFILLLRCCMTILRFFEFDLNLVSERCQILITLIGKLCPPLTLQLHNEPGCHAAVVNSDAGKSTDIFSDILEVFIDEFLVHHDLRKHFTMTDCVFSTSERLFASHCSSHDDVHAIMELVCSHFLLSIRDELSINRFVHKLSWSSEVDNGVPALGLDSVLSLLGYPVILSAPHVLQAHLIVLASACIGISLPTDDKKLDELVINRYILAFELSVKLCSGLIPIINFSDNIMGNKRESSFVANGLSFYSSIRSLTCDKLRLQIDRLIGFCHLHSHDLDSLTEAKTLDNCIDFIKDHQGFIGEEFKEEACSILNYIVKDILHRESKSLHEDEKGIQQEIFCVAAVLKLMSSSLLQIVCFLRQNGYPGNLKISNIICKEYDLVSGIINRFVNYGGGNQQIAVNLFAAMETTTGRRKDIKLMFSHFASFLSYGVRKKIDFLWKGCIFMMISLINLLIFEEGNLDAFQPVLYNVKEATFPHSSREKKLKDLVHNQSSVMITSNLRRARDLIQMNLQPEDYRMTNSNQSSNLSRSHMTPGCNSRTSFPSFQSKGPKGPICYCRLQTRMKYSECKQYLGKPYFSCPRGPYGCDFFLWTDEYDEIVDVNNEVLQDELVEHVEDPYQDLTHQMSEKKDELSYHRRRRFIGLIIGVGIGLILSLLVNTILKCV